MFDLLDIAEEIAYFALLVLSIPADDFPSKLKLFSYQDI
jgi:hypothetical protein